MLKRRAFVVAGGSTFLIALLIAAVLPTAVYGEPAPGLHRIGYLTPFLPNGSTIEVFRQGRGQDSSRFAALAAELVAAKPDIIVAQTGTAALALRRATTRIPIVMAGSGDAFGMTIAPSLLARADKVIE